MNKLLLRLSEVVALVCLVAFIIFVSSEEEISDTDPSVLCTEIVSSVNTEDMTERNNLFLKKKYNTDTDTLEYFCYYSTDSVMDVREILIIRADKEQCEQIKENIEATRTEKKKLFDSYAPEQSALLGSAVLVYEKGYLFYFVGENPEAALSIFRNNL